MRITNLIPQVFALIVLALAFCRPAFAAEEIPAELRDVRLDNHLGRSIPLDTRFTDEEGRAIVLGDYFSTDRKRPVVIVPVYYSCPSLCNYTLNGVVEMLKTLDFTPGDEFELVTVSFNPKESSRLASAKKANYMMAYERPEAAPGWHWLVGDQENIAPLMDALGFRYKFDVENLEYMHAPAVYLITPDGRISRYFTSLAIDAKDMRLALVEASNGEIGSIVDHFYLFCTRFDTATGRYTWAAIGVMRAGGILTMLILGTFIGGMLLLEHRRKRLAAAAHETATDGIPHDHGHAPV
jgi:protein SCO1/2